MSWLATGVVAIVTAVVGTLASGYVANLAVRWYHVFGFEGLSGYVVVALALLGLLAGLVIGIVASRAGRGALGRTGRRPHLHQPGTSLAGRRPRRADEQGIPPPIERRPATDDMQWSEWLPRVRPGAPALPDDFTYRYRVQRRSEPVRTEVLGPYEVSTVASYFFDVQVDGKRRIDAAAEFALRHRGQSFAVEGKTSLAGDTTGRFDRSSFNRAGLFLFDGAVLDTRDLSVHRFDAESDAGMIPSVPPLALSPDERSFVRFANDPRSDGSHVLVVTDFVGDRVYTLPVDSARMRFASLEDLDPPWLAHHFAWERDGSGIDRLVERKDFVPLAATSDST